MASRVLISMCLMACFAAIQVNAQCQSAMTLIENAEGFRATAYVDTTGHKTICYGFNLDQSGAQSAIAAVGGNFNAVYYDGAALSMSQCQQLLSQYVSNAAQNALNIFGDQGPCINAVLTDMTYNLGAGGMATFTTFISLITSHQWSAAANDLTGTLWCRQVGNRCTRDVAIIAAGPQSGANAGTGTPAPTANPTGAPTTAPGTLPPTTAAPTYAPTTDNNYDDNDDTDNSASTGSSSSSNNSTNIGVGVGVGIGGACVIAIAAAMFIMKKRQSQQLADNSPRYVAFESQEQEFQA